MKIAENGGSVRTPKWNSDDLTWSWFIRNRHFSYFTLFLQLLLHSFLLLSFHTPRCLFLSISFCCLLHLSVSLILLVNLSSFHFSLS